MVSDRGELDVARLYRVRFPDADLEKKARLWEALVSGFLQRWIAPGAVVLDLGCGHGEFLNHVRCLRRVGVDSNPRSADHLEAGIEFHSADVRDLSFLGAERFDVVFTSNFLEHLPTKRDVERVIVQAHQVLKRDGVLLLLGPNARFAGGRYWDFWDHHVPITDRSLSELLEAVGFRIAERYPQFLPLTTRSALPRSPWLVRLYLKLPPLWRFFGAQFLVRAIKG